MGILPSLGEEGKNMFHKEFPILHRKINGHRLVYLDNASTTQKPASVIHAMTDFYRRHNANVHRGIYKLSLEATEAYEVARDKVRDFINAKSREEIIFTSGATEAINLVVWTWGHDNIKRGDEILLTEMEHHSNLVPWQVLAKKKGARLRFIPVDKEATSLQLSPRQGRGGIGNLITKKTKLVSLCHISNVLGTINPIEKIIKAAHKKGVVVLVDGAQAGGHIKIDVQKLGADFYVLSGHKMYGPTGVGVLYGRRELLKKMPPYQYGGHMIRKVGWQSSTWADLPHKFEAGTMPIAEAVGLGAAVEYLERIENGEWRMVEYALKKLKSVPGLKIHGPQTAKDRIGVISFTVKDVPPHDLASIVDNQGVCIRAGHHCAMPLHDKLGIESSARVSLGIYNTKADIDALISGIKHAIHVFSKGT